MTHYVLIDGNNVAFQSQLAAMDKNNRAKRLYAGEQETTAINGAMQAARELQLRYPDARLLTLWDTGKAWRYGIYPEYKGNRKTNPMLVEAKDAIKPQRPYIEVMCDQMGIPQVTAENYEADDIAALMADLFADKGHTVTLVTRDQDWLQMVRPNVKWYDRFADKVVTHVSFEADTGFASPAEFSEAKVVRGDAGDNVTGIPGVGEVTAEHLISQFGTADNFLASWEEFVADGGIVKGHPLSRAQKKLSLFCSDPDAARQLLDRNRKLMDLRIMFKNKDLLAAIRKTPGRVDPEPLKQNLMRLAFLNIMGKFDSWIAPFQRA